MLPSWRINQDVGNFLRFHMRYYSQNWKYWMGGKIKILVLYYHDFFSNRLQVKKMDFVSFAMLQIQKYYIEI